MALRRTPGPVLTPELVLRAYRIGVFPMADPETGEIAWYSPRRRGILPLENTRIPRSTKQARKRFEVTSDRAFESVVEGCADRPRTWISPEIRETYVELFCRGHAHSVETWSEGRLAGGLYGVHLGAAFMAESMFHRRSEAGKVALAALLAHLRARGFLLCDIQMVTPVTLRFGAVEIPSREYRKRLQQALALTVPWAPFDPQKA